MPRNLCSYTYRFCYYEDLERFHSFAQILEKEIFFFLSFSVLIMYPPGLERNLTVWARELKLEEVCGPCRSSTLNQAIIEK